jgi:hypothetical protein
MMMIKIIIDSIAFSSLCRRPAVAGRARRLCGLPQSRRPNCNRPPRIIIIDFVAFLRLCLNLAALFSLDFRIFNVFYFCSELDTACY